MSEKCTTDFDVSGMSCSACQAAVERAVKKAGADDVSVNLLSGRMKVTHSDALSLEAIMEAVNGGVRMLCSAHGASKEDLLSRPVLSGLLQQKAFDRIVLLSRWEGPGSVDWVNKASFLPC